MYSEIYVHMFWENGRLRPSGRGWYDDTVVMCVRRAFSCSFWMMYEGCYDDDVDCRYRVI